MRSLSSRLVPAVAAVLLSLSTPAARAQIVNGSFEPSGPLGGYVALAGGSSAIPGWTTTDTGVEWFQPAAYGVGSAYAGLYVVDLANYVYTAGGVQQTIATIPGAVYHVDFALGTHAGSGRDGTAQIVVSAAAQSQTYSASNPGGQVVWTPCTFTFTANAATATLSFRCLQNANLHFAYVDGVGAAQVVPAVPATWGRIKALGR